jgi:hypothetical protein
VIISISVIKYHTFSGFSCLQVKESYSVCCSVTSSSPSAGGCSEPHGNHYYNSFDDMEFGIVLRINGISLIVSAPPSACRFCGSPLGRSSTGISVTSIEKEMILKSGIADQAARSWILGLILLAYHFTTTALGTAQLPASANTCVWDGENRRCTWHLLSPFAAVTTSTAREQSAPGVSATARWVGRSVCYCHAGRD